MNDFIYILSVNGLLFFISVIFYIFPPKKINFIYGYRTPRTMLNEDIWNYANNLFCVSLLKYSGIAFLAMILMVFVNKSFVNRWLPMALMVFTLLITIVSIEKKLNKEFDEKGEKKSKKQ